MNTIGSMFSGIGGLELGLEMLGVGKTTWQAESNPYARLVLRKHWPDAMLFSDVRDISANNKVDLVCGGFPCQDISNAGKRAGISGGRSSLWSEMVRVASEVKPKLLFVENVAALRNRGLDVVLKDIAKIGLNAEWGCFRASEVGAPHRRERMFILAYSDSYRLEADAHEAIIRGKAIKSCGTGRFGQVGSPAQWVGTCPSGATPMGVGNGVPGTVDRLRCYGNAVVPLQSAFAFSELYRRIHGNR